MHILLNIAQFRVFLVLLIFSLVKVKFLKIPTQQDPGYNHTGVKKNICKLGFHN
jgi:hypothetical protein